MFKKGVVEVIVKSDIVIIKYDNDKQRNIPY